MSRTDPEAQEKLARLLSAETLIDVRTVRKWLAGERVMRGNAETLARAQKALGAE